MPYTSYSIRNNNLVNLATIGIVGLIAYKLFKKEPPTAEEIVDSGGVPVPKQTKAQATPKKSGVNANQRYDSDAKLSTLASSMKAEFFNVNTDEQKIINWLKTVKSDADFSFLSKQFGTIRQQFTLIYRNLIESIQNALNDKEIADVQQNWNRKPQITIKL